MGACSDSFLVTNAKSFKEALDLAWDYADECRFEYGHNAYSGTFALAETIKLIPNIVAPSEYVADAILSEKLEDNFEKNRVLAVEIEGGSYLFKGYFRS